jgi:DNA invertase Pin-like site-specific DNA recombinase
MMRAAVYCRVSTGEQDINNQLREIKKRCRLLKWSIVEVYSETASGSRAKQAELGRMFADAHSRQFDVLVFWSLDRLSRDGVYKTLGYLHTLSAAGVKWYSVKESYIDSVGPFGDAIVGFLAAIAQAERARLRERTRAGLDRARAGGKVLGRPVVVINRKKVLTMRRAGKSWRACAVALGISPQTLRSRFS